MPSPHTTLETSHRIISGCLASVCLSVCQSNLARLYVGDLNEQRWECSCNGAKHTRCRYALRRRRVYAITEYRVHGREKGIGIGIGIGKSCFLDLVLFGLCVFKRRVRISILDK